MMACRCGNLGMVDLLLKKGCKTDVVDKVRHISLCKSKAGQYCFVSQTGQYCNQLDSLTCRKVKGENLVIHTL